MRVPFFVAVLAGAALAVAACARGDSIGSSVGGAGTDGGDTATSSTSGTSSTGGTTSSTGSGTSCTDVAPDVTACCTACEAGHTCQKNGCYNGYWCKLSTCGCGPQPAGCP